MKALLVLLLATGLSSWAQKSEDGGGKSRPVLVNPTDLLKCKPAKKKEEAAVRDAAEALNFSDHEVFSRLIFSEVLSTGLWGKRCEAQSEEALMEAIAWAVVNRVDKYSPRRDDPKPDAFFHVIFAPKQFSTSFSSRDDNPFAIAFLCPAQAKSYLDKAGSKQDPLEIYGRAKAVAARVIDQYQRNGIKKEHSRITHFFFPQSEFGGGTRPAWAKDPEPTKNKGFVPLFAGEKPCAEFYRR